MASDSSIFGSAVVPFRLTFLMWATFYLESFVHLPLVVFGIEPRTFHGLIGIFTAPLIHGDIFHLISNTIPLLFLGSVLFFFYEKNWRCRFFSRVFLDQYFGMAICPSCKSYWRQWSRVCLGILFDFFWILPS